MNVTEVCQVPVLAIDGESDHYSGFCQSAGWLHHAGSEYTSTIGSTSNEQPIPYEKPSVVTPGAEHLSESFPDGGHHEEQPTIFPTGKHLPMDIFLLIVDILIPSHYYYGSTKRYTYGWDPVNMQLKDVDDMEKPWEEKADIIFWRGASTGGGSHPPGFSHQYQRHRYVTIS